MIKITDSILFYKFDIGSTSRTVQRTIVQTRPKPHGALRDEEPSSEDDDEGY